MILAGHHYAHQPEFLGLPSNGPDQESSKRKRYSFVAD